MRYILLLSFLLLGCSNVSFNKDINSEPKEYNRYSMRWEKTIQDRQFLDRRPYIEKEQRKH